MRHYLVRLSRWLTAGSLIIASLLVPAAARAASTCTWTGGGADSNWSTAGNWTGCGGVAPVNGDSLIFPDGAARLSNANDISSLSLASLTVGGGYTLAGNNLTVTDLMTVDTTNASSGLGINLTFGPHSGGSGNTVFTATSSGNNFTFAGTTTLATGSGDMVMNGGNYVHFSGAIGGTTHHLTLNNLGEYFQLEANTFTATTGVTVNGPFIWCSSDTCFGNATNAVTVTGGSRLIAANDLTLANDLVCDTNDMCFYTNIGGVDYTLTGHITLSSDTNFATQGSAGMTGAINGPISGTANLAIGPGTMTIGGTNTFTGSVDVGGTVTATNAAAFGNAANVVTIDSGRSLTLAGDFDLPNPLAGSGNLTVTSGAHSLTGAYSNTGAVAVSGGSLSVNTDAHTSTFAVSGGTVKGTGTLGDTTFTGGTLAPGNSPGIIHISGNLTLAPSPGSLSVEINGATAGTQYDQTVVTGTANLNGSQLNLNLGYVPAGGATFTILTAASVTGTFAGLPDGATVTANGTTFTIHYTATGVVLSAAATPTLAPTGQNTAPIALSAVALLLLGGYVLLAPRRSRLR